MSAPLSRFQTAPDHHPAAGLPEELLRSTSTPNDELHHAVSPRFVDDQATHHYRSRPPWPSHLDDGDSVEDDHDKCTEVHSAETAVGGSPARDVEANMSELAVEKLARSAADPNVVTWESADDPQNPKNWTYRKKWAITLIVSSFTFLSPLSSSMIAPALDNMAADLGVTSQIEKSLVMSIFVLGYAIGPLFLGPCSEIYGRAVILQLSNLFFLAFNLGCSFAQTRAQLVVFRFLSGLGGSAPLALGGGVLGDCWHAEQRGRSISIYSLAPLLGPAVGPIAGGFIAMKTTWRWCFWSTSAISAAVSALGALTLQETYAPKILSDKAKRLRKATGNPHLRTEWENPNRTLGKVLRSSLVRPFRLLGTQPIIQAMAVYMAYLYGLIYLFLSTFPTVWANVYHEDVGIGGLNYISLGVGFFLGTQICAPVSDRIYMHLKKRNNNIGRPEFRVPLMLPGACLVPIGIFIYGWTAYEHTHWIAPNIGAAIYAAGTIMGFQGCQVYLVDAYPRFAASAIAAAVVLRSLAGFAFPLFASYLYDALGLQWGNSLLGFIAIGLGIPSPIILWKFGQALRERSPYAAG